MAAVKSEQILVETRTFRDLNIPLTKTSRLRYTSLSVSEKVLALGSNTGGIYIFSKSDCKLLQVAFADKETAPVTQLQISPNEKFVAFNVSTGKVHVIDFKLDSRTKSETLRSVTDLGGASVTCLKWDGSSSKLFIGDDMGKVSMVPVHTSKAKNLFSIPMEVILKLDSAIVQLDKADDKLLVSTLSRCYLCDTAKQQYTQIGKKPRDGQYGACFLSQGSITSMIYCARPGSRIWEVDMEGGVLNTHQFKQLLAVPPLSILDINRKFAIPDEKIVYTGQSVAFPRLKIISETFLLTWNSTHIFILDPVNVRLILWTDQYNGITDICCVEDEIFVFLQSMQVYSLTLMSVPKAIQVCMADTKIETVARLCCFYGNILHRKHLRKHLGVPDLYKIYDALVVNEMLELSASVLSCIKDIETRVAMESDTDNSDSNRSRSSSVHSASSEHLTVSTGSGGGGQRVNKDSSENGTVVNEKNLDIWKSNSDVKEKTKVDFKNSTEIKVDNSKEAEIDFVDSGNSEVNETPDELEGAISELHTQTCDINMAGSVGEINDVDGIDAERETKSDINKDIMCNQDIMQGNETLIEDVGTVTVQANDQEIIHGNETLSASLGKVTVPVTLPKLTDNVCFEKEESELEKSLCEDLERGEPDGNSYRDEYNENQLELVMSGDQQGFNRGNNSSIDGGKIVTDLSRIQRGLIDPAYKSVQECNGDSENEETSQVVPFSNDLGCQTSNMLNTEEPPSNDIDDPHEVTDKDKDTSSVQPQLALSNASPVSMKEDNFDIFDDDDSFLVSSTKSFGPRRHSLTSLSSMSSAEVSLDQPYTVGVSPEPVDKIAVQVRRRSASKKKKRKSSTDIKGVTPDSTGSPTSLRSLESMTEGFTISPVEEDVVTDNLLPSSDGTIVDHTDSTNKEPKQEEQKDVVTITETAADDFSVSGEFQQSSEWGVSGEYSTPETTLLQSWDSSKDELSVSPSSAPKTAFLKFKTKMQSQVTTKTKKLIQNIKDKNLLTKAKEMAVETFSQNSDVSMGPGGYFDPDQFESFDEYGSRKPETRVKLKPDGTIDESINAIPTPLIDVTDLQEVTDRVKGHLEDAQTLTDIDAIYKLLSEWVTILNETFHKFHVRRFAPALDERECSINGANGSNNSNTPEQNEMEQNLYTNLRDRPDISRNNINEGASQQDEQLITPDRISDSDLQLASDNFEKILCDPDFCYLSDPIQLPVHLSRSVSTLVQACFDVGCHGDILTYQKLNQATKAKCDAKSGSNEFQASTELSEFETKSGSNDFHNLTEHSTGAKISNELDIKMTVTTENRKAVICNTNMPLNLTDIDKKGESEVKDACIENSNNKTNTFIKPIKQSELPAGNTADSRCDKIPPPECDTINTPMNFFIRLYYPYLQLHKVVREDLDYAEWSALVTCLQGCAIDDGERLGVKDESIISHVLESKHQKNGSLTLLGHLSRLFFTEDRDIVDATIRCFPHIQPIDVLWLCRFHSSSIDTVFKQYMFKMLEHLRTIHKPDVEECLFSHHEVRQTWIDLLLMEDFPLDTVKDSHGNPKPLSHRLSRKNSLLVDQVLAKLCLYQPTDLRDMLSLCYKYGYWNGALKLLKHLKQVEDHFKMILYLRDGELLSDSHTLGHMPSTLQEWELLFTLFKNQSEAGNQTPDLQTPDWSLTVTWNSLAILLVRNVGPDLTLSLLERCGVAEGDLNAEFYQTCLLSGVVQKHKRSILHSMLERVDTYLWSQRPAAISPQVHYLLVNEGRLHAASKSDGERQGEETVHSLTTLLKGDKSGHHTPYAEDPECHWGVKTKFNMYCGCCNISLKETVSHTESGVLLFRCGHGFHKQCLPDRECILCDEALYTL